jgi:glycosyltransferase involved in cell wall biosynthesis
VPPPARGKGERQRFAHLGSFGGSRNPDVLLAAVRQLLEERPALAETVRLDFYGHSDAASARRLREFPVPGVVTNHGRVPRREALAAMRDTDILILIQNIDDFSAETIPSKVYEYLAAGRPILGLVHRNAELAGMLAALGHTAVEAGDVGAVRGAVSELRRRWEKGTLEEPARSPYTIASAVERLVAIAESREQGSGER